MAQRLASFPAAKPESAGLDGKVLEEFRRALRKETSELKSLAGAAHIVLHRGRCVFSCSGGTADGELGTRFTPRTLCRLHGATKPLVAAAFLTLVDAGKCRLSDPVAKYVPFPGHVLRGCANAKAGKRGGGGASLRSRRLARAAPPARLRDLLTNTAGLANYEDPKKNARVLRLVKRGAVKDLAGLCGAISEEPLHSRPRRRYDYSFAFDVLGRVCEVVSGKPLDRFMEEDFFKPLGMLDTHFRVPPRKRRRTAVLYNARRNGKRQREEGVTTAYTLTPYKHPLAAPGILSGGGGVLSYNDAGLWGTAEDCARFCQMLLSGGLAPSGRRVLCSATTKVLWEDALGRLGGRGGRLPGWHDQDGPGRGGWWDFRGLSLLHAFLDLDETPRSQGRPRRSRSMWFSGGGGAFWTIDGARGLVTVSFTQTFGGRASEADGHGPLAYRVSPYVS
uniref:Beta-lactamase-related domain-containing protein n=1 Tax=Alexandrium monilatum TaxID=311494 RepID=A0A7S4V891_9DINO|mmetsp:Transcript_77616/g.231268  ORF Transcript_77616/g.231268 Transcript_77616/m.231268 type:complete len:448 (+) Transcript_77616:36-1379(+)